MAQARKNMLSNRGLPLFILASLSIVSLLMFSFMVRPAYAWSVASYAVGADGSSVVRVGSHVYVANEGQDTVKVFAVSNPSVVVATISSVTGATTLFSYDDKVYAIGSSTLYEIDHTEAGTFFVSRSVGTTSYCANLRVIDQRVVNVDTGEFICIRTSADLFRIIDLDTMTITFTSASLAADCDAPDSATWSPNNDRVILNCDITDTLVSYPPNSSTFTHKLSVTGISGCLSSAPISVVNRVLVCQGSGVNEVNIYSYTVAGGFVAVDTDIFNGFTPSSLTTAQYDEVGRRFIGTDSNEVAHFIDDNNGDLLASVYTGVAGVTSINVYAWGLSYLSTGASDDKYAVFNMVGLPLGSQAIEEEEGVDCTDDEVGLDFNLDGVADFCASDTNNDGTVDFDLNDIPWSAGDPGETIPGFFQAFGFNEETGGLLGSVIVHIITIFGTAGVYFWVTKASPPMFIWVAMLVFGGGISAAMGIMPLIYFFLEIALVVGAVAALIKAGVIGT